MKYFFSKIAKSILMKILSVIISIALNVYCKILIKLIREYLYYNSRKVISKGKNSSGKYVHSYTICLK